MQNLYKMCPFSLILNLNISQGKEMAIDETNKGKENSWPEDEGVVEVGVLPVDEPLAVAVAQITDPEERRQHEMKNDNKRIAGRQLEKKIWKEMQEIGQGRRLTFAALAGANILATLDRQLHGLGNIDA